jgi:hypothetical protein
VYTSAIDASIIFSRRGMKIINSSIMQVASL